MITGWFASPALAAAPAATVAPRAPRAAAVVRGRLLGASSSTHDTRPRALAASDGVSCASCGARGPGRTYTFTVYAVASAVSGATHGNSLGRSHAGAARQSHAPCPASGSNVPRGPAGPCRSARQSLVRAWPPTAARGHRRSCTCRAAGPAQCLRARSA